MTNKDDLRMVAEFDGWKYHKPNDKYEIEFMTKGEHFNYLRSLEYHTSFNWQIPVWSKLIYKYTDIIESEHYAHYHAAIDDKNPEAGFQIIVNILKRMK